MDIKLISSDEKEIMDSRNLTTPIFYQYCGEKYEVTEEELYLIKLFFIAQKVLENRGDMNNKILERIKTKEFSPMFLMYFNNNWDGKLNINNMVGIYEFINKSLEKTTDLNVINAVDLEEESRNFMDALKLIERLYGIPVKFRSELVKLFLYEYNLNHNNLKNFNILLFNKFTSPIFRKLNIDINYFHKQYKLYGASNDLVFPILIASIYSCNHEVGNVSLDGVIDILNSAIRLFNDITVRLFPFILSNIIRMIHKMEVNLSEEDRIKYEYYVNKVEYESTYYNIYLMVNIFSSFNNKERQLKEIIKYIELEECSEHDDGNVQYVEYKDLKIFNSDFDDNSMYIVNSLATSPDYFVKYSNITKEVVSNAYIGIQGNSEILHPYVRHLLIGESKLNTSLLFAYMSMNKCIGDIEMEKVIDRAFLETKNVKEMFSGFLGNHNKNLLVKWLNRLDIVTANKYIKKYKLYFLESEDFLRLIINPVKFLKEVLKIYSKKESDKCDYERVIVSLITMYDIYIEKVLYLFEKVNLSLKKAQIIMDEINKDKVLEIVR